MRQRNATKISVGNGIECVQWQRCRLGRWKSSFAVLISTQLETFGRSSAEIAHQIVFNWENQWKIIFFSPECSTKFNDFGIQNSTLYPFQHTLNLLHRNEPLSMRCQIWRSNITIHLKSRIKYTDDYKFQFDRLVFCITLLRIGFHIFDCYLIDVINSYCYSYRLTN